MNWFNVTLIACFCKVCMFDCILTLKYRHKNSKLLNENGQPSVKLEEGPVILGQINKSSILQHTYYSFQGIPYAKPPVGDLRFRSPVPLPINSIRSPFKAYQSGPQCFQFIPASSDMRESEDCLSLNVYIAPDGNHTLYPVMVWLYGGTFIIGNGSHTKFGPDYLLERGEIIIVTVSYRLGVFGFLSTEDSASPGNYALKDQVLALKWVHRHIRAFDGDPQRVTVFGQSAGSVGVSYLMQTPLTKGLFQQAILQSGTTLTVWSLTRQPRSLTVLMAAALNIDTSSSESIVNGLRKVPAKELQTKQLFLYIEELLVKNPLNGLPFGPTMEDPGPDAIVVKNSYEQVASGQFHHVPSIVGFNTNEALPFIKFLEYARLYLVKYDLGLNLLVPPSMNISDHLKLDEVDLKIKLHYFGIAPITFSLEELLHFASDDLFNRPILQSVRLYNTYSPVYMYRFAYNGSLKSTSNSIGVGHAAELPYIWRMSPDKNDPSQSDLLTILRMTTLWTNFVKTGKPTPISDPLFDNVVWPLVNESGSGNIAYLDINKKITAGINPNYKNEPFWKILFDEYGNRPFSTY